jgi:outer membrane protein
MLRITVKESDNELDNNVRITLEGKLAGPWVHELEAAWQQARQSGATSFAVDLCGVDFVSSEGKKLLRRMKDAGAEMSCRGLVSRSVVDDISRAAILVAALFVLLPSVRAQQPEPLRLSLRDAVNLSLKQNPQVIVANLDIESRHQDQNIARSALLPQLNASVSDTLRRGNVETNFGRSLPGFPQHIGPFYAIQGGGGFSAPLFDLTLWRRYQSSQATASAARAQETTAREQATLLVVSQYLGAQRASADLKAAQSRVELAQALYDQAADLQKNGVGTGIDTLRANVELKNESQRLIQAQTQLETSLYGLSRLLGLDATRPIQLADEMQFSATPEFTVAQSLQTAYLTRPEMVDIRARQQAAISDRKAASAQRIPRLHVDGGWSEQGITTNRLIPTYEYGATIDVPIFTGGRIEAQQVKAEVELKKLAEQQRDLQNRISVEIQTAVAQLNAARSEVDVANAGADLAREEVTQARDRFQAGVANNIEVISAQDALTRASDNQIAALYRFNQARADLAHSVGRIESLYGK